ncbi:hypothetical protein DFH07DRAFT_159116 [Mycena maculata]|uniref:F-box domain-containing protein n=1 Tax=Mycena maculata TaxID=230809 RepID=A0AAD7HYD1_9AGAR|nr:hypothetical protein DFH07DRAFT_159116 [Mycena maculata]
MLHVQQIDRDFKLGPDSLTPLIHANFCPSDAQLKNAREILFQAERTIKTMQLELAQLDGAGDSLSDSVYADRVGLCLWEQSAAEGRATQMRFILSPWRRLPRELQTEIFLLCVYEHLDAAPATNRAPLLLLHVCRSWRAVVLGTPEIWTMMCYHIDREEDIRFIENWISRSGVYPLQLRITAALPRQAGDSLGGPPKLFGKVKQLVEKHMHRLQTLRLDMPHDYSALLLHGAPLLYALEFDANLWKRGALWNRDPQPQWGVNSLPALRQLTFRPTCKPSYRFPWRQLTSLSLLGEMMPQSTLQILSQCPALITFRLSFVGFLPYAAGHETTAILPALQELYASSSSPVQEQAIETVFSALTLPELRVLDIRARTLYSFDTIGPLLQRSACHLDKLSIDAEDVDQLSILQYIRSVSGTLTSLALRVRGAEIKSYGSLLRSLTLVTDLGGESLCPNLETILLAGVSWMPDGLLADMVESRWRGGKRSVLKRVVWPNCRFSHAEHTGRLERLRDEGLEIYSLS